MILKNGRKLLFLLKLRFSKYQDHRAIPTPIQKPKLLIQKPNEKQNIIFSPVPKIALRNTFVPKILLHESQYFQQDKKEQRFKQIHDENEKIILPKKSPTFTTKLPSMEEFLFSLNLPK